MNGRLNIYSGKVVISMDLTGMLAEEFPEGHMIHADGKFFMAIPNEEIEKYEQTETEDRYWLKNKDRIVLSLE